MEFNIKQLTEYTKDICSKDEKHQEAENGAGTGERKKEHDIFLIMRQREVLGFRTPQHPSLGTNNWGGASPLLARDIPKESLEQRYLRLNSVRTHGEEFYRGPPQPPHKVQDSKTGCPPTPSRIGFLLKLMRPRKEESRSKEQSPSVMGSNPKKKRWLGKMDPKNRWPQGWC